MAVTETKTARQICTSALRKIGVCPIAQEPDAADMALALDALFNMLKAWQSEGGLWTRDPMSVALVDATASYALSSPARPRRILSARYKSAEGIETPMERLTRQEYDLLPLKTTAGIPTTFYYDRAREQGTLYVWPVKATVTTETVELTIEAEIEDPALSDALDVPAEWYDATVYGLAARLSDDYAVNSPRILAIASDALMTARAAEDDESVFLGHE